MFNFFKLKKKSKSTEIKRKDLESGKLTINLFPISKKLNI